MKNDIKFVQMEKRVINSLEIIINLLFKAEFAKTELDHI